jgi:hypothetical protein
MVDYCVALVLVESSGSQIILAKFILNLEPDRSPVGEKKDLF